MSGVSVAANLMIGSKFSSVTCSVTGRDPVDCEYKICIIQSAAEAMSFK